MASDLFWDERSGKVLSKDPVVHEIRARRREMEILREWNERAPDPAYLARIAEIEEHISRLQAERAA